MNFSPLYNEHVATFGNFCARSVGRYVLLSLVVLFGLTVSTHTVYGAATLTQRDYIFLNDDGTTVDNYTQAHTSATSTLVTGVRVGERMVARIQVSNTGDASSTATYRLQWASSTDNSTYGSWYDLSTTTEVQWSLSTKGALQGRADGVPLPTRQVSATTTCSDATYQPGRFVAGTATSTAFSIGPSKCTELAYAIETGGASLGTYYRLRIVSASSTTAVDAYTYYPTFQIESTRTLTYSKETRGSAATDIADRILSAYSSIAIGTDGFPVISYRDSANYLRVAKCVDVACSAPATVTVENSETATYISIAIGTDGYPVISYRNAAGNLTVAKCSDAACVNAPTITALNAVQSLYTSIAIGTDGYPIISYQGTSGRLDVAKCIDAACTGTPIITTLNAVTSSSTSIQIGTDGFPVISFLAASNRVNVAKCIDAACTGTPIITTLNAVASDEASLQIGADGLPVVSYSGASGYLNIAKCVNPDCTGTPTITAQNSVDSRYISHTIGTDGFPVISYYGASGYLNIAKCQNADCTGTPIITVANAIISSFTSTAIGADGFPIVSYRGTASGYLHVTKCGNASCASPVSSVEANLPSDSVSLDNFFDDVSYNNVASDDSVYDSLYAATSSRPAYNFKKASSTNTDWINVTWNGQVSVSTTTSLDIWNGSAWETLQSSTTPQANTDFTLSGYVSGTGYYDASYIVTARVTTGTTTQYTTLKTDKLAIVFASPSFYSATNQQFYVTQATTTLETMTFIDLPDSSTVTATNDIRISIATTTTNFRFDTDTTTLTFGGTAAGKVANPVSYENNSATLIIPVSSDFSAGDTLTIAGARAGSFAAISTTVSKLTLHTDGNALGAASSTDIRTMRITGKLTLADHSGGQISNQFAFLNSTDVPLFAFSLAPAGENASTTALMFNVSPALNVDSANIQNIRLYRDYDHSKTYNTGDVAVGGSGVFTTTGKAGTITFSSAFLATTTADYLMVADLSGSRYANMMTIQLSTNGVTSLGVTSLYSPVMLGSVTDAEHRHGQVVQTGGAESGGDSVGGTAPAGAGTYSGGGSGGGSAIVTIEIPGDTLGDEVGSYIPGSTGTQYNEWTTGANAYLSNGAYATAGTDNLRQSYGTFNITIPAGNTITGIGVKLEAAASTATGTIDVMLSWDGDTSVTSAKRTTLLTTSDAIYTLGGQTDLWGTSWTPTYFTNGNLMVRVIAHPDSNTVRIDAIQVHPYHQAGGGGSGGGDAI
jgi:hypothetical protein